MTDDAARHDLPLLPGQQTMLARAENGPALLLLMSMEFTGPLDREALARALRWLTLRHEALRTIFVPEDGTWRRRVLARWTPRLSTWSLRPSPGEDHVRAIHTVLAASGRWRVGDLVRRPPVAFVLTHVEQAWVAGAYSAPADVSSGSRRHVLSVLAHQAILDRQSVDVLWQDLLDAHERLRGGREPSAEPAPSPERIGAWYARLEGSGELARRCAHRASELAAAPHVLALPSDLHRPPEQDTASAWLAFGLSEAARRGADELSRTLGVSRTAVLLCAWALVLGRRCATDQLIIGVPVAVRPPTESLRLVASSTVVVPVHCRLDDRASVGEVVRRTAHALGSALAAGDVPLERLAVALGVEDDPQRYPLVQVILDVTDEPVPGKNGAAELKTDVHIEHCGGSVFDLTLNVRQWSGGARLVLQYAIAIATPEEAGDLADSFDAALGELAQDSTAPLATVRTISSAQMARLLSFRQGPPAAPAAGLWQLVAARAEREPARVAIRDADPGRPLTYRQLVAAAGEQAAELAAAGVRHGDHVAVALPRSAAEIVAVLASLRLGAAYVPIDLSAPDPRLRSILRAVAPRAVLGPLDAARRVQRLAPDGCATPSVIDPWAPGSRPDLPPPGPAGPDQPAYVAFTSGSTGVPKGVPVPHRAVSRLVRDVEYVRCGPGERFLRFAPLAFDASTLEIFAPLVNGGSVEVYPDVLPSPTDLANFLAERRVTVLWLAAGLFRILVDVAPQAFARVRQILTGGDVVPPEQVRRLLERYPGLRVTNGYGPTENTTFTTVHHIDDPCEVDDPLPIGTPIPGTAVLVLDPVAQFVPPGAVGELYTGGDGLALDYLAAPSETAAAMGAVAPDTGERLYRTGDVVRWDSLGRLLFLGRRDQQIKIRGFRIEPEEIQRCLLEHVAVQDAVVVAVGNDADSRQLLAAVVSDADPALLSKLRDHVAETLPPYAVPTLWAVVNHVPLTHNGKVDRKALQEVAVHANAELHRRR